MRRRRAAARDDAAVWDDKAARDDAVASDNAATALDSAFFVFGGFAAIWLAYVLLRESFSLGWGAVWFSFCWWVLLAYLVLPRVQQILTRIYVPNYFIGRARTSDGLLGDPVNLAFLGEEAQIHSTMSAAGWNRADDLSLASGWRIVRDTLARRSYRHAPVSPLVLFDRRQDFAYQQQVGSSPGARHHVRFWRCPDGWKLPGGRAVDWVASGSFDRSVGLSLFTLQVTHRVASDTDAERDHIVETVSAADRAVTISIIEDFSAGYHARNGGGDSIVTDGNLPIVNVSAVTLPATGASATSASATVTSVEGASAGGAGAEEPVGHLTLARRAGVVRHAAPPAPVVVGTVLLLARAAVALVFLGTLLLSRDDSLREIARRAPTVDADTSATVFGGVMAFIGAFAVAEIVIAWNVYLGHNAARVLAMSVGSAVIVLQAIELAAGTSSLTLMSTLTGLSLDVLLVLALSSERARRYAREGRSRRRHRPGSGPKGQRAALRKRVSVRP